MSAEPHPPEFLVDTEVIRCLMAPDGSTYAKGRDIFFGLFDHPGTCVSPVTIGEVQRLRWFKDISQDRAEDVLTMMDGYRCLNLTKEAALRYANLDWEKSQTGRPQQNNRWQVALASHYVVTLATLDDEIIRQAGNNGVAVLAPRQNLKSRFRLHTNP